MGYSSDLSDEEWLIIEPILGSFLEVSGRGRNSKWRQRKLLDGMLYQLKNGCNWEDLPKDFLPYSTVYWHYKKWRKAGIFEKVLQILHEKARVGLKKSPAIRA